MSAVDLRYVPIEELEQELERRKKQKTRPPMCANPNLHRVIACIHREHEHIDKHGWEHEDFAHYIYESVMEAFYGEEYWVWHNSL